MYMSYSPNGVRKLKFQGSSEISFKKSLSVKKSLPESFKNQVKEIVKRDIAKGDYMSEEYKAFHQDYMQKNISPNRSRAMSMFSGIINKARYTDGKDKFFNLFALSYRGKMSVGANGQKFGTIYNESGEIILEYNSLGNPWTVCQTKAEDQFWDETTSLYSTTWDEVKAEMQNEQAQMSSPAGGAFHVTA